MISLSLYLFTSAVSFGAGCCTGIVLREGRRLATAK